MVTGLVGRGGRGNYEKCDVRGRRGSAQCDGSVTGGGGGGGGGQNFRILV